MYRSNFGIALVYANRLIFDGGQIENEILAKQYSAESLEHSLAAQIDNGRELATLWADLERYEICIVESKVTWGFRPFNLQLEKLQNQGSEMLLRFQPHSVPCLR